MTSEVSRPSQTSRLAAAAFTGGCYLVLLGSAYLLPFVVEARAQENDVFMGNLAAGVLLWALGSILSCISLGGLGVRLWVATLLAIGNLVAVWLIAWAMQTAGSGSIRTISIILVVDACLLLADSLGSLWAYTRWSRWREAVLLALAALAVVGGLYLVFGGRYYAAGERVSSLPPYLNAPIFAASLVCGALIAWVEWRRARR